MIRSLVPNVEVCKKLRDAGYPQEGCAFYWYIIGKNPDGEPIALLRPNGKYTLGDKCAAPLSEELARELPDFLERDHYYHFLTCERVGEYFEVGYVSGKGAMFDGTTFEAKSEAEARAKMYLYLSSQNLLPRKGGDGEGR